MSDSSPLAVTLAQRIKSARAAAGLQQQEVADAVGVSLSALRSWEAMRNMPPADKIAALCRTLSVSADYFMGLTDHQQGLRPGAVIVDQEALERFRFAAKPKDAEAALLSAQDFLTFAKVIPGQARLMSHAEYLAMLRSLLPVFQRHGIEPPAEVHDDHATSKRP